MGFKSNETLCWYCKRSGFGDYSTCPWERKSETVSGWQVIPTRLLQYRTATGTPVYLKSYHVISCPMYIKGRTR